MKKLKLQNKTMFSLTMVISLLSVFVCAISTFAWFQINSQPVQTSLKTGTGNISFVEDEIYGYKVNPEIGANGKINYDNDTVTKKNGSTISTSNSNQEGQDINFDIPDQGIGYYLIKQNSSNTYTYNSSLATKFVDKTGSSNVNSHYIASKTLTAGENYRVKKYTFENNKTVYEQVPISTTKSTSIITLNNTVNNATYDFSVSTTGTYKIWLIYSSATDSWDLTLEDTTYSVASYNLNNEENEITQSNTGIKRAINSTYNEGYKYVVYFEINISSIQSWSPAPYSYAVHLYRESTNVNGENWEKNDSRGLMNVEGSTAKFAYYCSSSSNLPNGFNFFFFQNDNGEKSKISNGFSLSLSDTDYATKVALTCNPSSWSGDNFTNSSNPTVTKYTNNTYYFENTYSDQQAFNSVPKVYAWKNDGSFPEYSPYASSITMSTEKVSGSYNGIYSIVLPNIYDRIIFNGTSYDSKPTQTENITTGSSGYYWVPSDISEDKYTGSWKSPNSSTNITFYLLDVNNSWSNHYVYAFGSANGPSNNVWPGTSMTSNITQYTDLVTNTQKSYTLYTISISQSFTNIIFNDGNTGSTHQLPTSGGFSTSTYSGKYYVLLNSTTGYWYNSVSAITSSTDTLNTYRIFDKDEVLTSFTHNGTTYSGIPHAHAWFDNPTTDTISSTYYVNPGTTWPGITLTSVTGMDHVYQFQAPSKYINFILNNGKENSLVNGAFQTADLTGINGLEDHAYSASVQNYYVLKGNTATQQTSGNITYFNCQGYWVVGLEVLTLNVSYFLKDGSTYTKLDTTLCPNVTVANDFTYNGENYTPNIATSTQILDSNYSLNIPYLNKVDSTNGILYYFEFDANLTWYTSEDCLSNQVFTNGDTVSNGTALYCRAYCDVSNMKTFYIDTSHSGIGTSSEYWQNISVKGQNVSDNPYFTSNDSSSWKISNYLYRITMPSSYTIRISERISEDSASSNDSTNSRAFEVGTTLGTSDYLVINKSDSSATNCSVTACTDLSTTNFGTATINVYNASGTLVSNSTTTMSPGDGSSNYFVYELGLTITSGYSVEIVVSGSSIDGLDGPYKYANYIDTKPAYVSEEETNKRIKLSGFTGDMRFNFYITSGKQVSIAMVPGLGNGYYIMPYENNTNTYKGAIKMSSGSETSASYSGFYASANQQIFIKSYINGVDTLYTQTTSLADNVSISDGVITFGSTAAGYYDIDVYNGKITISRYNVGDFFKLNALDLTKNDSSANIKDQKTSLLIEVAFKCNNTYKSKISLTADNPMSAFVGANLYCTTEANKLSDPYNDMRSSHYDIQSTTSAINDEAGLIIPANSNDTYYAYILIDYLPDSGSNYDDFLSDFNSNIYFYLNATQYIEGSTSSI